MNLLSSYNINAILEEKSGVNLGVVYETAVAQELRAHGHNLYYYDRRKIGEIDYLIDDYDNLSVLPIEIKSARDNYEYSALPKIVKTKEDRISKGFVFSNKKEVKEENDIIHFPIYYIMFV